jgi:archaellum component FlaG (FlaF/FlaG flagellin family)
MHGTFSRLAIIYEKGLLKLIQIGVAPLWRRRWRYFGIGLLLLCAGLFAGNRPGLAADPPNQPFDLIYSATDVRYNFYNDGLGMLGRTTGTLNGVNLNGTAIVKAYLIWAGLGRDDQVQFQRVGGAPQTIVPDRIWNNDTFGANTWDCCGNELSVYVADITDTGIVALGDNAYTISNMSIEHIGNSGAVQEENWGFSLVVVYADPTITTPRDFVIKLGNDGLFYGWSGLLGPNSDVQCYAFEPANVERKLTYSVIVGGVENETRFNALWGMTGNSAVNDYVDPTVEGGTWTQDRGLIRLPDFNGVPGSIEIDGPEDGDPPFADRNGDEWDEYPRFDRPLPANHDWGCLQVESSSREQRPSLPPPGPGTNNMPASIGFLGFIAVTQVLQPDAPEIDIVKLTNGQDANDPDGSDVPVVAPGAAVTWTYAVTNTGTVDIPEADITVTDNVIGAITAIVDKADGDAILAPGEVWIYQAVGTALDLTNPPADPDLVLVPGVCTQGGTITPPSTAYTNIGIVTIPTTSASDPSSYCGPPPQPTIDIIKYTNGLDANDPDGADVPVVGAGQPVTWTYAVTNTGTVTIPESDITVTDNVVGAITAIIDKSDGDDRLAPGEVWVYQAVGVALDLANPPADPTLQLVTDVCTLDGTLTPPSTAYTNIGVVTIPTQEASDPSSYCNPPVTGQAPGIDIIKLTNGQDANDPDGTDVPELVPGQTVTWTYIITNTGTVTVAEADIDLTDNVIGTITGIVSKGDGDDLLVPGETWTFEAVGTALNLTNPPDDDDLELVSGVCTFAGTVLPPRIAYTNLGTVTIPGAAATDPSSYCNIPPSSLDPDEEPLLPNTRVFLPIIR